ncbi:anaerobic ribonucleoside-triphosphate reductase activating protein [Candidatus Woesearchaeota archaeon]|jgi:pyruvate formate lyase activating enzyme|nr:anaerobic ribonucleoside-triphosphate reductase activating protein [Candidatus Woesearchaeota archaeon]MBT4322017.1 anaerobic ribonucleoside-triphosphate reductase activating protein [Candidatus Woesearchaeota archaeon]MBT4630763.1 anaerobic ribonucleoside-triphosphate reductase activating protein [Candidatus Woesearchaeota archaeon]
MLAGIAKLSLIDYPGKVCSTVFLQGCNFRCSFCHNPELVNEEQKEKIPNKEFFDFLDTRKGLLDGVCITGGEPTIHSDLKEFIIEIKNKGFLVKLDTNGTNPEVLKELIDENLIDYIAMDIKTSIDNYEKVVNVKVDKEKIKKSVELIKNFPNYEFRTTLVPGLISKQDLIEMGEWLKGSKLYVLQQFISDVKLVDPEYEKTKGYSNEEIVEFSKMLEPYFEKVNVR